MIASDVTDFPEPGLADDAEHLAGGQIEVDAADRLDDAVLGRELDVQVLDAEDRTRRCLALLRRYCELAQAARPSRRTASSGRRRRAGRHR